MSNQHTELPEERVQRYLHSFIPLSGVYHLLQNQRVSTLEDPNMSSDFYFSIIQNENASPCILVTYNPVKVSEDQIDWIVLVTGSLLALNFFDKLEYLQKELDSFNPMLFIKTIEIMVYNYLSGKCAGFILIRNLLGTFLDNFNKHFNISGGISRLKEMSFLDIYFMLLSIPNKNTEKMALIFMEDDLDELQVSIHKELYNFSMNIIKDVKDMQKKSTIVGISKQTITLPLISEQYLNFIKNSISETSIDKLEKLFHTTFGDNQNINEGMLSQEDMLRRQFNDETLIGRKTRLNTNDIEDAKNTFTNDVVLFIDVSGSVNVSDVYKQCHIIDSLAKKYDLEGVRVYTFNTRIVQEFIISRETPLNSQKIKVGGGTSLENALQARPDIQITSPLTFVFTDMYMRKLSTFPTKGKVYWLIHSNYEPLESFKGWVGEQIRVQDIINDYEQNIITYTTSGN